VVIALVVVAVVTALKPPAVAVSATPELDNSSANLVMPEVVDSSDSSMDTSSTQLKSPTEEFSYQDSLTAALSQRWEMNTEDDSVRL
jgi:hypothetical protein